MGSLTPSPTGTAFYDPACPNHAIDQNGLDPEWAMMCGHCLRSGTVTPLYGNTLASFPTYDIVPFPISGLGETTIVPPTITPTGVSGTLTPTITATPCSGEWSQVFDFTNNASTWSPYYHPTVSANTAVHVSGGWRYSGMVGRVQITRTLPQAAYITSVRVVLSAALNGNSRLIGVNSGAGYYVSATGTSTMITVNATLSSLFIDVANSSQYWVDPVPGLIERVTVYGTGVNPFTGVAACPSPSPVPTQTLTPSPTYTPQWWATAYPQQNGVSVSCASPEYVDLDAPLVAVGVTPNVQNTTCFTIVPRIDIEVPDVLGLVTPDIDIPEIQVCFVPITIGLNLFGFWVDVPLLLGLPAIAFLFRWLLFN